MSRSRGSESVRGDRIGGPFSRAPESAQSRTSARVRLGGLQKYHAKGIAGVSERLRVCALVMASVLAIAAIVTFELIMHGSDLRRWDLLFDSACVTVIAGLWLARGLPEHFATTVERLTNRGAFTYPDGAVSPEEVSKITDELHADARRSERIFGVATGGLIALSFLAANTSSLPERRRSRT
jgi:hypothetical protein